MKKIIFKLLIVLNSGISIQICASMTKAFNAEAQNHFKVAVKSCNLLEIQKALTEGADVNFLDCIGSTALMHAVVMNNFEMVELLLQEGADVNVQDKYYWTALRVAVVKNNLKMVKLFLEKGADVNVRNPMGETILRSNLRNFKCTMSFAVAEELLRAGVKYEDQDWHREEITFLDQVITKINKENQKILDAVASFNLLFGQNIDLTRKKLHPMIEQKLVAGYQLLPLASEIFEKEKIFEEEKAVKKLQKVGKGFKVRQKISESRRKK